MSAPLQLERRGTDSARAAAALSVWAAHQQGTLGSGAPDGGNLLHGAAKGGCYDIATALVVDFDVDPTFEAHGAGISGETPYDICVETRTKALESGMPEDDLCDPETWLAVIEEAQAMREAGEKTAYPFLETNGRGGGRAGTKTLPGGAKKPAGQDGGGMDEAHAGLKVKPKAGGTKEERKAAMEARIKAKRDAKAKASVKGADGKWRAEL